MRRILLIAVLLAPCPAAELKGPGPLLAEAETAEWQPLFAALAAPRTILSTFREERWFGFRKTPIILAGEMRLDPVRGLSLRYPKPDDRLMVIDPSGVLLRDAKGRKRELPADARTGGLERALLPALRFNLPELRTYFLIHAMREAAQWRLDLEPKDDALKHALGYLTIEGTGQAVTRLEFRRSATQRVVILIESTSEGVVFTPDELHRYFR